MMKALIKLLAAYMLACTNYAYADEGQNNLPPGMSIRLAGLEAQHIDHLLSYALSKQGLPYRVGGQTPKTGFDCSGFVRYVFDQTEGLLLPHSAEAISQMGRRIEVTDIHPGDLVFFSFIRESISHVGIYLGNEEFIHAASRHTGSVKISSLNESYWANHFVLARRLVNEEKLDVVNDAESVPFLLLESRLHYLAVK